MPSKRVLIIARFCSRANFISTVQWQSACRPDRARAKKKCSNFFLCQTTAGQPVCKLVRKLDAAHPVSQLVESSYSVHVYLPERQLGIACLLPVSQVLWLPTEMLNLNHVTHFIITADTVFWKRGDFGKAEADFC